MTEPTLVWLDHIRPNPYQPRSVLNLNKVEAIARSIAADRLLQPPMARKKAADCFELAFGDTRFNSFLFLRGQPREWFEQNGYPIRDYSAMPLVIEELSDEVMYRYTVTENAHREGISIIDEARAMMRAMNEFRYNSRQVGELFGKSDSTVRGTLRLLELPVAVQDMVSSGELSQGAARALLSMQRIAPEKALVEAAKTIIDKSERMTPEGVVQSRLSNYAYNMWDSNGRENDKPRAGYRGWPLDMKNFPNRLLPELTKSELPDIFGMQKDTRLLKILHQAETVVDVSMALGQAEDADLRELAGKIDILLDPPSCSTCPLYTRIGGAHYCGFRACRERKLLAWDQERLAHASRDLGIAVYQDTDGAFQALESSMHSKLFEARGPDLRLIEKGKVRGYPGQYNFKGIDTDHFYVVVVGKTLAAMKETRKAERALERAGQKVIRSVHDLVSDKKERLSWEAAGWAGEILFKDVSDLGLNLLHGSNSYWSESGPNWAIPKRSSNNDPYPADFLRRKLALNMLKKQIGYDLYRMGIQQYAEALQAALVAIGLPKCEPHLAEMARVMQAEVDEQFPPEEKPVSAETGS